MQARPGRDGPLAVDDRALLAQWARDLSPRLMGYIRRAHGNFADAEDIVAETFYRAAVNISTIRAHGRPDLYILTIARNLCRDRFRKQRPESVPGDRLAGLPHPQSDAGTEWDADERMAALRQAVAALPDNLREVVVLRMSGGMKFEEIAELLHIPLGTALSRMHSATRRMRETLGLAHEH